MANRKGWVDIPSDGGEESIVTSGRPGQRVWGIYASLERGWLGRQPIVVLARSWVYLRKRRRGHREVCRRTLVTWTVHNAYRLVALVLQLLAVMVNTIRAESVPCVRRQSGVLGRMVSAARTGILGSLIGCIAFWLHMSGREIRKELWGNRSFLRCAEVGLLYSVATPLTPSWRRNVLYDDTAHMLS